MIMDIVFSVITLMYCNEERAIIVLWTREPIIILALAIGLNLDI